MGKNPNYSFLPNGALLKIFQYSKLEDLYNLQQTCPKFQQLIEDLKRNEIEDDWRLKDLKYDAVFLAESTSVQNLTPKYFF